VINNINDFLREAAYSLANRDIERIDELREIVRGWAQTEEEAKAQLELLEEIALAIEVIPGGV